MEKFRFYGLYCNKLSVKNVHWPKQKWKKKKIVQSFMKAMYAFISMVR